MLRQGLRFFFSFFFSSTFSIAVMFICSACVPVCVFCCCSAWPPNLILCKYARNSHHYVDYTNKYIYHLYYREIIPIGFAFAQ